MPDSGTPDWMTSAAAPDEASAGLDTNVPHIARVYDYWLGGKDNFAADRDAAEKVITAFPDIQISVRAQRAFLGRAVHFLVAEAGVRQFLDIGTGLPSANNTHEVAQRAAPDSRVVYVDNDPIVLAHARALLTGTREGATSYLEADLRETEKILQEAAQVLDFAEPVAVLLLGVLHCISDAEEPAAIVSRLLAAVAPGSYLVISHPAADVTTEQMSEATRDYNEQSPVPLTMRTHEEVCRIFDGWELVEPGVVQLHRWRPGTGDLANARELANYGGVARKA